MDFKAKIKQEWPAIAILAVAAIARLALLGLKPPHFDEGVNGWFVDQMTHNGYYHYDPENYHGPLHFYILFLAQTLLGRHVWALRLPLALAGVAAVYLTLKFDRFMGRDASRWAALAVAISPGCVFYSRYAIHEYWLVLSLMLCAWGMAGLWASGERRYFWAIVFGATGAVLTKETYFIHFGCALLTLPAVWVLSRIEPATEGGPLPAPQWTERDALLGCLFFLGCVLFFYSGGLMDIHGLRGLYLTYNAWAKTGHSGHGHEKAWYYWLQLCGRYEWPALIGIVTALLFAIPRWLRLIPILAAGVVLGLVAQDIIRHGMHWQNHLVGVLPRDTIIAAAAVLYLGSFLLLLIPEIPTPRVIRALGIYGCGALAAYSIIHYKTPWCIVSLTWPFYLLFGWAVASLLARFRGSPVSMLIRAGATGILAAGAVYMVYLNFFHYSDAAEQYVYVQTYPDVNKLVDPVLAIAARNPANYEMSGHIIMDSYHPLPWLLGDFTNVGYFNDQAEAPAQMDADFLLVEETRVDEVEAALRDSYFTTPLHLRDAQDVSTLYLSVKKFGVLFPGRKPDFVPQPTETPASPTPFPLPSPPPDR